MRKPLSVAAVSAVLLALPGCGGVTSHPPDAKPSGAQPSQSSVKAGPSGTPKPAKPGEEGSGERWSPGMRTPTRQRHSRVGS